MPYRGKGQHFVYQQRGSVDHAPGAAAGTKGSAFTAEGDQFLGVASAATYPQESILEAAALQISVELTLHEGRQSLILRTHGLDKLGIMLLDELVKQRLFGTMAAVGATRFRGRTGRRIGHGSRPCEAQSGRLRSGYAQESRDCTHAVRQSRVKSVCSTKK